MIIQETAPETQPLTSLKTYGVYTRDLAVGGFDENATSLLDPFSTIVLSLRNFHLFQQADNNVMNMLSNCIENIQHILKLERIPFAIMIRQQSDYSRLSLLMSDTLEYLEINENISQAQSEDIWHEETRPLICSRNSKNL